MGSAGRSRQRKENSGGFGGKGRVKEDLFFFRRHLWRETRKESHGRWAGLLMRAVLGRSPEKKPGCGVAVSVKKPLNDASGIRPWNLVPEVKGHKVASRLFPGRGFLTNPDLAEVVKTYKRPVPPAKAPQNYHQPAGNEPWGNKAFRVQIDRCAKGALLTHLPKSKGHKQCPDHRIDGVEKVRDQLNRQEGKGRVPSPACKAGNGYLLLSKFRENFDHIAPIRGDFPVAARTVADGAHRSDRRGKIDPTGKKGLTVFPKGLEFVNIRKLNFSAPCSQGERLWAPQTFGPVSLLGLVIFPRSIPYLAHSAPFISSVKIPCKYQSLSLVYIAGDNT